jgi:putative membrane protein
LEDEAMVGILLRLLANALIIFFVARMVRGIEIRGFATAIAVAVVLGLFNALLRPLLIFLTLPITVITLGLFIFVLNALLFWLVSAVVPGFVVEGFFPALLGAFLVSLGSLLVSLLLPFPSPSGRL